MVPPPSRRDVLIAGSTVVGGASLAKTAVGATAQPSRSNELADGWPMEQRDPAGTGYAPAASGPKNDVSVRWRHRIDTGLGFAYRPTPIVTNGLVYGIGRELIAVETATGDVAFRVDREYTTPPAVTAAVAYRVPTLAFAGGTGVDGLHARGGVSIAGVRFGFGRWAVDDEDDGIPIFGSNRRRSIPIAAGGTVFVSIGPNLLAIDGSSGRIRWRAPQGVRRPAVHDGTVYVAAYDQGLLGYDIETGDRTFAASHRELYPLSVTATVDRLVVGTADGLAGLGYEGEVQWTYAPEDLSRDYGAVAVAERTAFAGVRGEEGTQLAAVDTTDGTERWRSDTAPAASPQFAPPTVAEGVVYVPTEDGGLAAVDAEDGHVRWQFDRGDPSGPWSPVAVVGETLYAQGNGYLYALEEA